MVTTSSSSKWTNPLYRDYLHCIGNVCATVLNIFSKEILSNNTKCRKHVLKSYETLESTGEVKLMMKLYLCLHNSLNFEIYFLDFPPRESYFWCDLRQLFIYLTFRKRKKGCTILNVIRVQGVCPLKTGIARFSIGLFVLRALGKLQITRDLYFFKACTSLPASFLGVKKYVVRDKCRHKVEWIQMALQLHSHCLALSRHQRKSLRAPAEEKSKRALQRATKRVRSQAWPGAMSCAGICSNQTLLQGAVVYTAVHFLQEYFFFLSVNV